MSTKEVGGQSWVRKANGLRRCVVSVLQWHRFLGVVTTVIFPYGMNINILQERDRNMTLKEVSDARCLNSLLCSGASWWGWCGGIPQYKLYIQYKLLLKNAPGAAWKHFPYS